MWKSNLNLLKKIIQLFNKVIQKVLKINIGLSCIYLSRSLWYTNWSWSLDLCLVSRCILAFKCSIFGCCCSQCGFFAYRDIYARAFLRSGLFFCTASVFFAAFHTATVSAKYIGRRWSYIDLTFDPRHFAPENEPGAYVVC